MSAKPGKGFHSARQDLQPARSFVVYSGSDRFPVAEGVEAIGVRELVSLVADL